MAWLKGGFPTVPGCAARVSDAASGGRGVRGRRALDGRGPPWHSAWPGGNPGRTVRRSPGWRMRRGAAGGCGAAGAARRGTAGAATAQPGPALPGIAYLVPPTGVLPALAGTAAGRRRGPAPCEQASAPRPVPTSCRNHPSRFSWPAAGLHGGPRPSRARRPRPRRKASCRGI